VGALFAWVGLHALVALAPADIPRLSEVGINGRVLAAAMTVSIAVGLVFGLVPMSQAFRLDVAAAIQRDANSTSGGRARRRFRQGLVVTELALSVMLVVCAGLLVRSLASVLRVDPGFVAQGVLKAQYQLPVSRYPNDYKVWPKWNETHRFNDALLGRVRALPGVTSAAIAVSHPLDAGFTNSFTVVGREAESHDWPEIRVRLVTPGYFATLGVPVREGRVFDAADVADAPFVAVINEAARKRFFPNGALGQELRWWGVKRRIVGVVADERIQGIVEDAPPAVYAAIAQAPSANGVLLVRTSGDPAALESTVRNAIHAVDPELAVYGLEPLSITLLDSIGQRRFTTVLLGGFAAATLVLALIGVHGVLTYTTAQRSRELGIRVALGATRSEVVGLVLRGGLGLVLGGVALGLLGAWAGSSYLRALLFGVTRSDPFTYVVVPVLVVAAAMAATWMPARRAARVQPVEALKA
jgi:predicted permease